mmetsp:Transcript_50041/g.150559  ORF Transcript_50041/g.150559 Transcript_50041/m.150559 type:complete len:272 (+) Transcript_50041:2342-3157(+)
MPTDEEVEAKIELPSSPTWRTQPVEFHVITEQPRVHSGDGSDPANSFLYYSCDAGDADTAEKYEGAAGSSFSPCCSTSTGCCCCNVAAVQWIVAAADRARHPDEWWELCYCSGVARFAGWWHRCDEILPQPRCCCSCATATNGRDASQGCGGALLLGAEANDAKRPAGAGEAGIGPGGGRDGRRDAPPWAQPSTAHGRGDSELGDSLPWWHAGRGHACPAIAGSSAFNAATGSWNCGAGSALRGCCGCNCPNRWQQLGHAGGGRWAERCDD